MPIESKELGFTKPGPYIYELLADLNITHETSSKIIDIIEEAAVLLEEDKQHRANGTVCRLESIGDILKIIFKEKDNGHANFYRVSLEFNNLVIELESCRWEFRCQFCSLLKELVLLFFYFPIF